MVCLRSAKKHPSWHQQQLFSPAPLKSPEATSKLPPDSSICVSFSMASMASLWASSNFATGPDMVKDLSRLLLPLTTALHRVLSQISGRSAATWAPDTKMGPLFWLAEPSQLGKPSPGGRAKQALAMQLCCKPLLQGLNVMAWDDCWADGIGMG